MIKMTISFTQPMMYGALSVPLVQLIYPVVVLFWMLRPSVAEALRKGGVEVFDTNNPYPSNRLDDAGYDDRGREDRLGEEGEGYTSAKPPRA